MDRFSALKKNDEIIPSDLNNVGWDYSNVDQIKGLIQQLDKPYCIVKNWQFWDIQHLISQKVHAYSGSIVWSLCVIDDEAHRFSQGSWLRSTLIQESYNNCIFCTKNTSYILIGPGSRRKVSFYELAPYI